MKRFPALVLSFFGSIIFFTPIALRAADHCEKAVTDAFVESICRRLIDDTRVNQDPEAIVEATIQAVNERVGVGQLGTFGETDGCYEISRIQTRIFSETHEKAVVDTLIDQGDGLEREIIQVASSQIQEESENEEFFASVSIQVFLRKSDAIAVGLKADKRRLDVQEKARVTADLKCQECPLGKQEMVFASMGPGEITPQKVITDEDGEAELSFTATGRGTAMIVGSYRDHHAELEFQISRLSSNWDVDITIRDFYEDRSNNDQLQYMERWTSEVEFRDVLFHESTYLDQLSPLDLLQLTQSSFGKDKKGPYYRSQGRFTEEEYIDFGRKKHLKRNFRGRRRGEPLWIMLPSIDCHLESGLATKSEDCLVVLSIHLWEGLPREDPVRVYFEPDYYRRFRAFNFEVKYPLKKILDGQPFSVDHEENRWHEIHVTVRMKPKN
jgi:hypothetical protein